MLTKVNDMDILMEDSLDGGPPSVGSGDIPAAVVATPGGTTSTPVTTKKVKQNTNNSTFFFGYSHFLISFLLRTNNFCCNLRLIFVEIQQKQSSDRLHIVLEGSAEAGGAK